LSKHVHAFIIVVVVVSIIIIIINSSSSRFNFCILVSSAAFTYIFLGAFEKFGKETTSFIMSVRLSVSKEKFGSQ
jgi:hypothetical protein